MDLCSDDGVSAKCNLDFKLLEPMILEYHIETALKCDFAVVYVGFGWVECLFGSLSFEGSPRYY